MGIVMPRRMLPLLRTLLLLLLRTLLRYAVVLRRTLWGL